jgi:cation diffusion facilitator family transporter
MGKREDNIVKASVYNIIGNAILAVAKITIGLISGSLAVVGDGIDSASDIVASVITLVTARVMTRSPNIKYPYGYAKADTIATKALSFIIFFAGAQLAISTISKLFDGYESEIPSMLAIYVTVFSIIGKIALSAHQYKAGKQLESQMLIANAKNMQNDIFTSVGVLIGLFFTMTLEMPILDAITAIVISFWIMKSAYDIFMETNTELMEGIEDKQIYKEILNVVESIDGAENAHRIRVRKFAHKFVIELDFEVDGNMTVQQSHDISKQVEEGLKNKIDNVHDIITHVDPLGEIEQDEQFGISKKNLDMDN